MVVLLDWLTYYSWKKRHGTVSFKLKNILLQKRDRLFHIEKTEKSLDDVPKTKKTATDFQMTYFYFPFVVIVLKLPLIKKALFTNLEVFGSCNFENFKTSLAPINYEMQSRSCDFLTLRLNGMIEVKSIPNRCCEIYLLLNNCDSLLSVEDYKK